MTESVLNHSSLKHQIFVLDAKLNFALDEQRRVNITNSFINEILAKLGMNILGQLQIFDATDLTEPGWSFIQPITTSHISGHYFVNVDNTEPNIHIDVYSCKHFSFKEIVKICDEHFSLNKWSGTLIEREIDKEKRIIQNFEGIGSLISF